MLNRSVRLGLDIPVGGAPSERSFARAVRLVRRSRQLHVSAPAAAGRKVMLMVQPENEAVRAFYQANGYDEQKRVILAKWLDGRPRTP